MAEDIGSIVDILVTTIERNFRDFNISEIVKGGSLGHGTGVKGKSDLDLVIYSRDLTGHDVLGQGGNMFLYWLQKLDRFLEHHFRKSYVKTRMTHRSVQFTFKDKIEVDLLVSPYFGKPKEFYEFLKSVPHDEHDRFTVCASKWQVEFFREQPPQVKEYIRKAKEWRDAEWPSGGRGQGRPSSYLLSLLMVEAYRTNPYNVADGIKMLVQQMDTTLNLTWEKFYMRHACATLLPSRPRIVDPANPANNVLKSGLKSYGGHRPSDYEPGDGKTAGIKEKIRTISNYL